MEGNSRKRKSQNDPKVYVTKKSGPLLESLKCNICLHSLLPPIRSCPNGHNVCARCFDTMLIHGTTKPCGECRHEDGYQTICRTLDSVVKSLFLKCEFGCGQQFSIAEVNSHSETCYMRPIDCPYGCSEELDWPEVVDHMRQFHQMENLTDNGTFSYSASLQQGTSNALLSRDVFLLMEDGDPFFVTQDVHGFGLCVYVQSYKQYTNQVTAEISVEGTNKVCKTKFTTIVGTVRAPIEGPNRMVLTADTIMGWCRAASQQNWKVHVEVFIEY